jgi:hypothetical protein
VSNGVFQFYVDNKKTSTSSTGSTSSIAQTYNVPTIRNIKAELSRVYNFNFDISAENAPYTLANYQTGKSIPPSLKSGGQVSLALEDYTITNGTTKMIFDVSGNNNDATITGNVSGDKDINIQRLVDFIKA